MQRLKLFGGASIEADDGPVTGRAVQRRRLALLALLATARAQGLQRERIIAFLWPEADAENGRAFLSDSVYRINQALDGDVIIAAGDELRLDPERLPSDVVAFADAVERGGNEEAVDLYAGPFLDGFVLPDAPEFERWVESERDQLKRAYARALEAVAESAERAGDPRTAVTRWRRLAAHDPYNSRVAIRLMKALDAAGERASAIQHARVHEMLLTHELEIDPDPAVRQLAEQLRSDRSPPVAAAPAAAVSAASPDGASSATTAAPVSRRPRLSRTALVGAVLGLATIVVGATWMLRPGAAATDPAPPALSIAVLPFTNLSPDRDNEYFSDGITEELIATLARVDGLKVASRTSVFAYKNQSLDVREVGRRLGVASVVEGSVRKSGRKLRITAQLVSTANGYDLWSEVYDRETDDVLAIQEEISRAIVGKMAGTLGAAERVIGQRPTRDAVAYDLYLRGRFAWHQRTRQGLRQAVEYFGKAVAQAPDYARAYVGLGDAFAVSAFYDYMPPREAYPKAEAAAQRALAIDAGLAAPHATLGYIATYFTLDWPRAEAEFQRALAVDPSYSTAHQWYGNLLTVAGRFAEAEREFRAAQEADPLSLIASAALGWSRYYAGNFGAADEEYRRVLALNADFELAHLWSGWALQELNRPREARSAIERAVQLSNGSALTRLALARLLARSPAAADRDSARAIARAVEGKRAQGEYMPSYEIAKVHLALGDRDAALTWLRRAVDERSHSRAFLLVDPQLAALRGDVRFVGLVRDAGLTR